MRKHRGTRGQPAAVILSLILAVSGMTVQGCGSAHSGQRDVPAHTKDLDAEMAFRCEAILQKIWDVGYDGKVVNGQDMDIF